MSHCCLTAVSLTERDQTETVWVRGRRPNVYGPPKGRNYGPIVAERSAYYQLPPVDAHSPLAARGGSDDVEALGVLDGLDKG